MISSRGWPEEEGQYNCPQSWRPHDWVSFHSFLLSIENDLKWVKMGCKLSLTLPDWMKCKVSKHILSHKMVCRNFGGGTGWKLRIFSKKHFCDRRVGGVNAGTGIVIHFLQQDEEGRLGHKAIDNFSTYPRRCHTDMVCTMYTRCSSQVDNLK